MPLHEGATGLSGPCECQAESPLLAAQALQSGGVPKPGARMLIQGGAGGVGHFAIQLAKAHFKAYVVATGGPSNQALMKVLARTGLSQACTWACLLALPCSEGLNGPCFVVGTMGWSAKHVCRLTVVNP